LIHFNSDDGCLEELLAYEKDGIFFGRIIEDVHFVVKTMTSMDYIKTNRQKNASC